MLTFNAWHDPWLPVLASDGSALRLSLHDVLARSHDLTGLGAQLTPLDRDAMHRFLLSVTAVVLRGVTDEDLDGCDEPGWRLPSGAIASFGARFSHRFQLFGEQPFMQRWDRTQEDLRQLFSLEGADAKQRKVVLKTRADKLLPLTSLHPHEPGKSSSKWAIRRDARDETQIADLVLLLVTTWFQTKNGNGQDPWGGKALKGSAGTWHVNPLAIYLSDPSSLLRTLLANIPEAWVDRDDLPLFIDHHDEHGLPGDFASAHKQSVTRFSYAKTLPLIYVEGGVAVGYVIGADQSIPVPALGKDDKESLGLVHELDHTRLYREKKAGSGVLVPRGAFGARLTTAEGFERWFRVDNDISAALQRQAAVARILEVDESTSRGWDYSVFSDNGDPQGNREWAAWDVMPVDVAGASGMPLESIRLLLIHASECRSAFAYAGKQATGSVKVPALAVAGQAAFYNGLAPVLADVADDVRHGVLVDSYSYAVRIGRIATAEFIRATDPLLVPSKVGEVARARATFSRLVAAARGKRFAPSDSQESA